MTVVTTPNTGGAAVSNPDVVPVTWQRIERALVDYFRDLSVMLVAGDGEAAVEVETGVPDDGPVELLLSDLAKHLERDLAAD
jgi:hypothetical protein